MDNLFSSNILIMFTIMLISKTSASSDVGIIKSPSNTICREGDTNIVLSCEANVENQTCAWTFTQSKSAPNQLVDIVIIKKGTVITRRSTQYGLQRNSANECSLIILNATLQMGGTYRCMIQPGPRVNINMDYDYPNVNSPGAIVVAVAQVIVIRSEATCTSNGAIAQNGDLVNVTCSVIYNGGSFQNQINPVSSPQTVIRPIFTWSSGSKSMAGDTVQTVSDPTDSFVTVTSTITVKASNNNVAYQCKVAFGSPSNLQLGVSTNTPTYDESCTISVVAIVRNVPVNTVALIGDKNVVLKCTVDPSKSSLWSFTQFNGDLNNARPFDRLLSTDTVVQPIFTKMCGIQSSQPIENDLVIYNVTPEMAGTYRCVNLPQPNFYLIYGAFFNQYNSAQTKPIQLAQLIVIVSIPLCSTIASVQVQDNTIKLISSIVYSGGSFQSQQGDPTTSSVISPIVNWSSGSAGGKSLGSGTVQTNQNSSSINVVSTYTIIKPSVSTSYFCTFTFGSPSNQPPGIATNAPDYKGVCKIQVSTSNGGGGGD